MGKKKKQYTPPKNTKEVKQKIKYMKILLSTVAACALVTLCWIAVQCADLQKMCLYSSIGISVLCVLQLFDNRKTHWDWGYTSLLCAICFFPVCVIILLSGVYWCFALWAVELFGCIAFALIRRKKE